MPTVTLLPGGQTVRVKPGATLLDAYRQAGLPAFSGCAGLGTCGKCRVRFAQAAPRPTPMEYELLTASQLDEGYRLACLTRVYRSMAVEVAFSDIGPGFKELAAYGGRTWELDPAVRRAPVSALTGATVLSPAVAETAGSDKPLDAGAEPIAREAILFDGEAIATREATGRPVLGVAFDIGTTSLAAYLVDLETGTQRAALGLRNPQAAYGADVISRIDFACHEAEGLAKLQALCISGLERLIAALAKEAHCSPDDIFHIVAVGNPTMVHLFLGVDPMTIATAPFTPVFREARMMTGEALGLRLARQARVETLPLVSGYVGADTVAMAVFLGLDRLAETCVAIDIGTNGEIILAHRGRLYACSTAAGPAFEGARIACGMRAQPGAIGQFRLEGADLGFRVMGGGKARGISGSGLVSLVALLLEAGLVSQSGRFVEDSSRHPLGKRLRRNETQVDFVVASGQETIRGEEIALTQRDIRELQLAKGAMAAGMRRLLDHAGLTLLQLDRVYLAGAFGSGLDPWSARRIGLLPPIPLEKVVVVGNAAGGGAKAALCSREMRREAVRIAQSVEYVELSGDAHFDELFMEALAFPSEGRAPPFDP